MVTRSRELNTHYTRMLGIGLGISLVVHGAVLGLGRLSRGDAQGEASQLSLVEVVERDLTAEETEVFRVEAEESSLASAAWRSAASYRLTHEAVPVAALDLSESRLVLAAATSKELIAPLVPRPRVIPEREDAGLTPMHVREPMRLATRERGRSGSGGDGVGVIGIFIGTGGGGVCVPGPVARPRSPIRQARVGTIPSRIGFRSRF